MPQPVGWPPVSPLTVPVETAPELGGFEVDLAGPLVFFPGDVVAAPEVAAVEVDADRDPELGSGVEEAALCEWPPQALSRPAVKPTARTAVAPRRPASGPRGPMRGAGADIPGTIVADA